MDSSGNNCPVQNKDILYNQKCVPVRYWLPIQKDVSVTLVDTFDSNGDYFEYRVTSKGDGVYAFTVHTLSKGIIDEDTLIGSFREMMDRAIDWDANPELLLGFFYAVGDRQAIAGLNKLAPIDFNNVSDPWFEMPIGQHFLELQSYPVSTINERESVEKALKKRQKYSVPIELTEDDINSWDVDLSSEEGGSQGF